MGRKARFPSYSSYLFLFFLMGLGCVAQFFSLLPSSFLCVCIPLVPWSADDANYYFLPLLWVSPAARRQHVLVVASRAVRFAHNTRLSRPFFFYLSSAFLFFASLFLLTFLFCSFRSHERIDSLLLLDFVKSNRIFNEQKRLEVVACFTGGGEIDERNSSP